MTLLQLQSAADQGNVAAYIIIAIILSIVVSRAVFSIAIFVRHTRAQTNLLAHIAEKLGVEKSIIDKEVNSAEKK